MATKHKTGTFNNKLYYGDNLDVLRDKIYDETVDLCYIDPPFNSKRNYFQIYKNIGGETDKAQAQAFEDTWEWGDEANQGYQYISDVKNLNNGKFTQQTVDLIQGLKKVLGEGSLFAYLVHMTQRISEIHRVLKPTGSFYLHCDPTASHYLKLILDSVFCAGGNGGDFLNEIVWRYQTGGASKRWFGKKHDIIFLYSKSSKYKFFPERVMVPRTEEVLRRIKSGTPGATRATTLEKLPDDVFEIQALNAMAAERLGYPTQKPEALLERIIKASSDEGDVVLDAYCGCGTTVAVAQKLKRRWIGIDITYQSISLILKRLKDAHGDANWSAMKQSLLIDGVPKDKDSAIALANRKDDKTRKEFEKWAVLTYSDNQARINEKKGADGGIDGVSYFLLSQESNGKVIYQVKSGGAQSGTIDNLRGVMEKEKAEIGILLTMDPPTKPMKQNANKAGKFIHPLINKEYDRIQIVSIDELLNGSRIDLPLQRDMVKAAEAAGDIHRQQKLI